MKYTSIKICLVIAALFCGVASASNLPDCPSSKNAYRHSCFGTFIHGPESEWAGDKYVGQWKNGQYNGQGTLTYGPKSKWAGDKYVGQFKITSKNGQGTYTYSNGDKYVGEWKDGLKNGRGTYTWANGDKYVGEFRDNNFNGQGTKTYQDGRVEEGIWKDDWFQYTKAASKTKTIAKTPDYSICSAGQWCSDEFVCSQGTLTVNGESIWNETPKWNKYVVEAKKRGLSCGVLSIAASKLPDCPSKQTAWWHNCFGTFTHDGSKYVGEYKDNKRNGQGTFTWKNGSTYVGQFKDNLRHGEGTFKYGPEDEFAGDSYVGQYKNGLRHGKGTQIYLGISTYSGEWVAGDAHGHGVLTYPSGDTYAGEFRYGKQTGQGTLVFASGAKYVGDWKDNKRTGRGVYTSVSGSIYKGEYKDNKWSGQGTLTYGPKSKWAGDKYVGSWKNDKRNGKGKYTYADGTIKEGIWEDGKLQGLKTASAEPNAVSNLPDCPSGKNVRWHNCFGNYTYDNGNKYVGEWKDNQKTGQGIFTWKSGNIYVGEFKDNKNSGQGVFTYKGGDKYVGEFKDSSFYGQGTFTYKSGRVDKGTWKDDKLNGQATVIYINGDMFVGEFTDDKRIKGTYTYGPQSDWAGDKYVGGWRDGKRHGQGTYTFADGTVRDGTWKDGEFEYAKTPTKPVPVVKVPTQDDQAIPASSGSGFAVSSAGYVMTNSHVIDGCQDVFIHTPEKDVRMRVISNDPKNDLALLKGNFKPLAVFSLSSKRPEILQDIYVAGYPFGYKVSSSVKVTKGIISSLTGIGNDFSNMQIDAALQSGNSGGPILDDMGNVVGVAVAKLDAMQMLKDTGSIPENTNFGIKASVVKSVLDSSSVDTPSANKSAISKSQLGKMITDGTYYISCWMTMAQIEKVRSKKVLFSELD